jgi:hypothetical protein
MVEEIADAMRRVAAPDFPRAAFAAKSREIIADWGANRFANGLSRAVEVALSRPRIVANALDRALLSLLMRR